MVCFLSSHVHRQPYTMHPMCTGNTNNSLQQYSFRDQKSKILEERGTAPWAPHTVGSRRVPSRRHIQRACLDSTAFGTRPPSCFLAIRALGLVDRRCVWRCSWVDDEVYCFFVCLQFKAAVRTFNPREPKYMAPEPKFRVSVRCCTLRYVTHEYYYQPRSGV